MPDKRAYDLLVLIDADAPEERRGQILDAIKKQIASGDGDLKGDVDWGVRKLTFEIRHRGDAYYHLFQLEAGSELLKQLEHSLAIDDAVLRHRIIRLPKGTPENPPRPPTPSAPRQTQPAEEGSAPASPPQAPAEPEAPVQAEAPPETPAEAPPQAPAEAPAAPAQEQPQPAT